MNNRLDETIKALSEQIDNVDPSQLQSIYKHTSNAIAELESEKKQTKQKLSALHQVVDKDDPRTEQGFRDYNQYRDYLRNIEDTLKRARIIAKVFKTISRSAATNTKDSAESTADAAFQTLLCLDELSGFPVAHALKKVAMENGVNIDFTNKADLMQDILILIPDQFDLIEVLAVIEDRLDLNLFGLGSDCDIELLIEEKKIKTGYDFYEAVLKTHKEKHFPICP